MARLSEQEQQEVIRFVEAGKPLPEKYRFLLFEDKREVELVVERQDERGDERRPAVSGDRTGGRAPGGEARGHGGAGRTIRRAWQATEGLDEQADLGRQQTDFVFPEERPVAGGD